MDTNSTKGILWFRNDLRLHDHEAMRDAINHGKVYPVYVFDERVFLGETSFGFRKTDVFRAQFIIEAINDLRKSFRDLGSDLIVRVGKPELILPEMAKDFKTNWVFCNRERTQEELDVQDALEKELWAIGQELRFSRGKMLYYTSDLPFPVTQTPDTFTQFRKEVEKFIQVRRPIEIPLGLPSIDDNIEVGDVPTLIDLGFSTEDIEKAKSTAFRGGEKEGLKRLEFYFNSPELVSNYKNSCDTLLGNNSTSNLSAYLAHGCLSPKRVYHKLVDFEKQNGRSDSTHELFMELLWRDYHRLIGKKFGNALFKKGGTLEKEPEDVRQDEAVFKIWSEGRTGVPFVDAAITQLNTTGYIPFKARRVAASFLIYDLNINWQLGASYFESLLIDYDPCSNWGNWNTVAGVSIDTKESRHYNVVKQAKKYDLNGAYVSHWIPSLQKLSHQNVHEPYLLTEEEQEEADFVLGRDYPRLCIQMS
jgi:deoxyribodipyrimidine photo-lyase